VESCARLGHQVSGGRICAKRCLQVQDARAQGAMSTKDDQDLPQMQSSVLQLPKAPTPLRSLLTHEQKACKRRGASAAALFVIHRDHVAAQWYYGHHKPGQQDHVVAERSQFNVYSIRKTYIGLTVSNLLYERRIAHLDLPLAELIPEPRTGLFAGTTVRHLLTHTHGLDGQGSALYRRFAAGTRWHYTNAGISLLCEIVSRLLGCTVRSWLHEVIWKPLGFGETVFADHPEETLVYDVYPGRRSAPLVLGEADGAGRNLYVSARELAAWGYLHLRKGQLPGRPVLASELFMPVTVNQSPAGLEPRFPRHGFCWWIQQPGVRGGEIGSQVPADAYQIVGMSGCLCLVIPSLDVVAVRMHNSLGGRLSFVREARAFGDAVVNALQSDV